MSESLRGRPSAEPILIGATFLVFASYAIDSRWVRLAAPVLWVAFLVGWHRWLRSENRARPGPSRGRFDRRGYVVGWLVLMAIANLIMVVGCTVSWVLAGVLMAGLVARGGVIFERFAAR